jgi:hypothetical protein
MASADSYICLEKRTGKKVSCSVVAKKISGIFGIGSVPKRRTTKKRKTTKRRRRLV